MPDRVSVFGMRGSPACTQVRPFASLGTRLDPGWIHLTCACGSCGKVSDFVGVRSASSSFDYKANVVGVMLGCQPFAQPCNRYPLTPSHPLPTRRYPPYLHPGNQPAVVHLHSGTQPGAQVPLRTIWPWLRKAVREHASSFNHTHGNHHGFGLQM